MIIRKPLVLHKLCLFPNLLLYLPFVYLFLLLLPFFHLFCFSPFLLSCFISLFIPTLSLALTHDASLWIFSPALIFPYHTTTPLPQSTTSILIVPSHLCLDLPSGLSIFKICNQNFCMHFPSLPRVVHDLDHEK